MSELLQFDTANFQGFCEILAKKDKDLRQIIRAHGTQHHGFALIHFKHWCLPF